VAVDRKVGGTLGVNRNVRNKLWRWTGKWGNFRSEPECKEQAVTMNWKVGEGALGVDRNVERKQWRYDDCLIEELDTVK
jgi:hypothetical protein